MVKIQKNRIAIAIAVSMALGICAFFGTIGLLTFLFDRPLGTFTPTSSADAASWLQAAGSIAAIIGSYFIGASQASKAHESAMELYRQQRGDVTQAENVRDENAKSESLVTIAGIVATIRRMHTTTVELTMNIDIAAAHLGVALREHAEAQTALQKTRGDAVASQTARVEMAVLDIKVAVAELESFLDPIDDLVSRLGKLPRHDVAVARPQLAKLIVRAIHALNRAAIEIEHGRERAKITSWMREAEQALASFGQTLADENPDEPGALAIREAIRLE